MRIIQKQIYTILRNYLKKHFTGNLGKVVEEEDRLVCYVKKRNLKSDKYNYTISCFGINKNNQKLANDLKLNKPICYILDGITCERKNVRIFGYDNCEIIVKNCKFNWGLELHVDGRCTLESTSIREFCLLPIEAKEMVIKNMNINQELKLAGSYFIIGIDTQKLSIIDSNIGEQNNLVDVAVTSNTFDMIHSKIMGNTIQILSPMIKMDDKSAFIALKNAKIETENFQKLTIDSPTKIFNGKDISKYGKNVQLEKVDDPIRNERLKLLEVLKNIRDNCNRQNAQEVEDYKNRLNHQSVSRVLIKK